MALGSGGALGTLTLYIKADTSNLDSAIASVEQKMKRYGSNFAQQSQKLSLTPTVDDSALTALNQHLDLKQKHFSQVGSFFKSSPLAPSVNLKGLDQLESKLLRVQKLAQEIDAQNSAPGVGTTTERSGGGFGIQPTIRVNPRLASVTNRIGGNGEQSGTGGIKATVPVGKVIDAARIIITSATISVGAGKVAEGSKSKSRSAAAVPMNAPGLNPKVDETVADSLAAKLDEIERRIDRINNKTISIKEDRQGEKKESQGGFNPVAGAVAAIAFQGLAKGISASIAGQVQNVGDGLLRSFAQSETFKNLTKTLNVPPEVAQSFGREAGKEFKKSQQTGVLGFLSKTIGNVFTGITQGIGHRISSGLLQGLERSFGVKLKDVISDAFEAAFNQTKQTLGDAAKSIFNIDFGGKPPTPPKPPGNVVPFPTQQEQAVEKAVANGQNVVRFRQRLQPNPPDGMKIPNPVQGGAMVLSVQKGQQQSAKPEESNGGLFGFVGDFFGNAQKTMQAGLDGLGDGVNSFANYLASLNPFFKELVGNLKALSRFDFIGADSLFDGLSQEMDDTRDRNEQKRKEAGRPSGWMDGVAAGLKKFTQAYFEFYKFAVRLEQIAIKLALLPAVILKSFAQVIPAFKPLADIIEQIKKFFVDNLYGGSLTGSPARPKPNENTASGRNYSEVLGVDRTAPRQEVIAKFKQLSRENHPDRGGSPEKMQELTEAYSIWKQRQERLKLDARSQQQKPTQASPDALKQVMSEGVGGIGDIFSINSVMSLFADVGNSIRGAIDGLLGTMSNFFGDIAENIAGLADNFGIIELERTEEQKVQQVFADLVRQAGAEAGQTVSENQIPKLQFDDDITEAYKAKGLYFPQKENKTLATGRVATVDQNTLVLRKEAQKMLLAIANGIDPKAISDQYGEAAEVLTHEVKHAFQFKFGQADYQTLETTGNFGDVTPFEKLSPYGQLYGERASGLNHTLDQAEQQQNPARYIDFIKGIEGDAENFGQKYRDVFSPVAQKYQEKAQTKAQAPKELNLVQQIFKPITDLLTKLAAQVQGVAKATLAIAVKSLDQTKEWFKHLYQDPTYTLQKAVMAPLEIAGDALASPVRAVEQNIRDSIAKTVSDAKAALETVDIRVEGNEEFGVAASALYEALALGADLLPLDELIANFGDIIADIQKLQSLKLNSSDQIGQFGEIMQQLPAVRKLVTVGARRRKDKNIKSAADDIYKNYDPIQGNEFDKTKKVQMFAVGGYRNAMGMDQPHAGYGSIELAEQFKIATGNDESVQINPHVNAYSDSKNPVMRTVGNVIGTQANDDAVSLAKRAYAAHRKNPEQRIVLGGHSGGGFNVQDALEILKELNVPATGFGMQTPNFNITRKLGVDDYEALGSKYDDTVNDKLMLARKAGFKAEQDAVFAGQTHSPDEFLARKESGEAVLRNIYGETREQPKTLKNNIRVFGAPRVIQEFERSASMARDVIQNTPNSPVKTKAALAELKAAREKANKAIAKFPEGLKRSIQQMIDNTDHVEAKLDLLANAQGVSTLASLKNKFNSIASTDIDNLRNLEKEVFSKLGVYSESIDVQVNDLIKEVGQKLRAAKRLARESAGQQSAIAAPAQQPQQSRAETSFRALVARSAKASNYGMDMSKMPKLVVDNKRLQQAGAKALYSVKDNQIVITSAIEKLLNSSPEELKKFGSKYAEEVKDLIHEIRHAFQFDLGNLNYADLAQGAKPGALTPFKQTSSKSQQYGSFAANTDYYKQYAAQMPSGFLDIVRATEADATNFESMWQDIMQGLISDLEQVQAVSSTAVDEPVAYKFNMPGAFGSAAAAVAGQAQSVGNSAANKLVEELDKAQKHLNKIAANPKLQQSFGKLQQDAGNLSTRMGVLIQSIQSGTVDIGELPDEIGRIFGELQEVVGAAASVPANLRPQETWKEKAGNVARTFQTNAFGGFFDPKQTARQGQNADGTDQAEAIVQRFGQAITGEESAFGVIQSAIIGDWAEVFYNFYEEVDKALDLAVDSMISFVGNIPGLGHFANFLRGAKQFKAVAISLIGLQLAFKGFDELRQIFDGIEEAFIQAAIGAEKFQRTLTFVVGDAGKASSAIGRLQEESSRLGTDAGQSIQGYSQLGAAAKETALEGSGVDQISSAINQASAVYSLNPEEQGRVSTAVSQMISKNTVSAEELRQQLGEVLPGSFNIAARAAGKTTAEFNQMLESGQVIASDFLPKFAQQLSAETSSGLTGALDSSQAATNRLQNAINRFRVSMGKGLLPERNFILNKMAEGMGLVEKHAQSLANVMGTLFFRSLFKLGGAFLIFARNLVVAAFNIAAVAYGFGVLQTLIGALIRILVRFATQFVVFTLLADVISMLGKGWNDASGGLNNFVKSSEDGMRKYTEAVNEARKVNQEFSSSLPKDRKDLKGSSLMEDTFVGGIMGKENARGFENLLVDSLNNGMITGAPIKLLTGGKGLKKYAEKKLEDTDLATNEIMSGANQTSSQILTYRGTKKAGSTGELRKVQDIDKQLRDVQAERRGLSRTDPGNMEGIKALQKKESELLKDREKNFKPLGSLQSKLQGEIDGMKEALKKYDELAAVGGVDQETYKTKTDQLKTSLAAAEKQQIEFNRSIGGAADSFTYLQRALQGVADKLAGADSKIKMLSNSARRGLLSAEARGEITSGQSQFTQGKIESAGLEAQIRERKGAIAEMQSLLSQLNSEKVLEANGITNIDDVSAQELNTLADRSKDSPQDAEVFKRLAEVKQVQIETDDLETQLQEKQTAAAQQIRDANKQIGDYFRDVSRQAADLALSSKEAGMQIAMQSEKNRLKSKLQGFQDTFFSSFVDYLIEGVDTLNEPLQASLDREREVQAAEFARQDRDRQAVEIAKALPLETQAIKIDFSAIDSAPVKELQKSLQKSAIAGENITKAAKGAGVAIGGSAEQADVLGGSFGDAIDQAVGIESATGSVGDALQDNISQAQGVNAELMNNRSATDENHVAVESVNDAVLDQAVNIGASTDATFGSAEATNVLQQAWSFVTQGVADTAARTWEWFAGLGKNVPFLNQFGEMIAGWSKNIQGLIAKTWEWFQGLFKNIPFLQQIGQTISGWGQSVANVAGGLVGEAGHQLDRLTNWAGGGGKVTERYRTGTLAAQEYAASRDGGSRRHAGQDIDVSGNQEAQSFIGGVVTRVVHDRDGAGYGSYVDVYNKALGVVERIAEVLEVNVKEGQEIKAGQAIGRGESHTGVFHYEIRKPVDAQGRGGYGFEGTEDPIKFYEKLGIAKREGNDIKILKGMNAGQSLKASEHGVGDGHNHFGEDDLKKANQGMAGVMGSSAQKMLASMGGGLQMPSMSFGGGAGTAGKGNSGTATTPDQFVGAVLSILEAPTRQGRVDVAQVISNRVGTNFGGYGGNVRDQAFASGQFQPFFRETYGIGKGDIKDQSSAIAALRKAGYSAQQAQEALSNFFADIKDPSKVADTQSKVGGRAYFKGVSEQPHMRSDDFLRNKNENFFHHEDGDTKNRKLTAINAVFSGAAGGSFSGNMNTASAAPAQQMPVIAPVPFASMPGGESYSSTTVNTSRLTAAQAASAAMERKQKADAIAREQSRNKNAIEEGKMRQERALEERRRALLELDTNRVQLNRQFEDANLDNRVQTPQVEAQRGITNTKRTYEDLRKDTSEKLVQAKRGRDQAAGVLSELTSPNYKARPGQDVAKDIEATQRAIAAADKYIADLEANNAKIQQLETDALKFKAEMAAREKKVQEDQEKLATENVSISVLEAEADRLKGMRDRGVRDQGVEKLPKLEAEIAARREEAQLKGQIADLDEKIFKNQDNQTVVAELNKQKAGLTDRLGIVKKTIEANRAYSEEVMQRENNKINREANNAQSQQELETLKQQLSGLQQLAQLNPLAPGTDKIAQLEEAIALKELEIKLTNDLAAAEQERFENKINPQQYEARVKSIKEENEQAKANINFKRKQADAESAIVRARAALATREQDSEIRGSLTEARSKNIDLGGSESGTGDSIAMRFQQQADQQKLSFDKQMIDLDELANSGKRTKEEIDALRLAYVELNRISLENLATEQKRATEDRNLAISGKMVGSSNALLDEEAARYDRFGFGKTGDKFREQSAIASQGQAFAEAQVELERFIGSQNVSVEKAAQLRGELAQLNQVKLDGIQESFSPLKDVISGTAGSFKGLFTDLLSGTKTVGEAFKSFLDSILSNLANLAAEFITNELFSGLLGGNKKSGGGGGGIMGLLGGLMGGGGSGGGMGGGLGFLSAVPNLLGIFHDGGIVSDQAHLQAFANGGTVGGCSCRACLYAKGGEINGMGMQMEIEKGLRREQAMTGRKSRLIIASDGEIIVPHKVVAKLSNRDKAMLTGKQLPPTKSVPTFSTGGMVGGSMGSSINSNVTNLGGNTSIGGSTVNVQGEAGGSMSAQEARAMQAAIDQRVTEVVSKMTRPRGLLYR